MDPGKLAEAVMECQISEDSEYSTVLPLDTILGTDIKLKVKEWPRLKPSKIPPVFLHKPAKLEDHVYKILSMKIHFYQPTLGQKFTKISCCSHSDQKFLIKYFEAKRLPYHTFGNPNKKKIKVVIRGLPKNTDLDKVKEVIKSLSIPVIRVHKMKTNHDGPYMLLLAVVPYDMKGLAILGLRRLLGYDVTLEPPNQKVTQCYRCQNWGHIARYCHGAYKCVKCAGDHFYKKCTLTKSDPVKCSNCGGDHTANYKKCPHSPYSVNYEISQMKKQIKVELTSHPKPIVVTHENCHELYKNKRADDNHDDC